MASAERSAHVTWTGTLTQGSGLLQLSSGAAPELPVTWASRTARSDGKTSPEELIAGAHASCFSMAFSNDLTKAGTPPQRLDVTAVVTFAETAAGYQVDELPARGPGSRARPRPGRLRRGGRGREGRLPGLSGAARQRRDQRRSDPGAGLLRRRRRTGARRGYSRDGALSRPGPTAPAPGGVLTRPSPAACRRARRAPCRSRRARRGRPAPGAAS